MQTEQVGSFTVGTSETGSFCRFDKELDAIAEAKDWARSEPGVTVYVWACGSDGGVIDAVATFCFPYGSEAHADDYHQREYLLMDDEERRANGYY
jgi:hypothetical protein